MTISSLFSYFFGYCLEYNLRGRLMILQKKTQGSSSAFRFSFLMVGCSFLGGNGMPVFCVSIFTWIHFFLISFVVGRLL